MNNETNVEVLDDDFLGFDDADFPELTADGNQTGVGETETSGEEAQEVTTSAGEAETSPASGDETTPQSASQTAPLAQGSQKEPELFELNWLGQTQKHTREEMIALAQKGMDRDRILQQRDAAQQYRTQHESVINDLDRVAKQFGLEPTALLQTMEANFLRQQGKSQAEAEAIIRANKSERQLQGYQSREQQAQRQQQEAQERQQRDMREFVQRYPNMDYKTIPAEVWQDVRKGETLVNAYGKYEMQQLRAENQRLQQQLSAKAQNEANQQKSLGSMHSGVSDQKTDTFLDELFRD